MKKTLILAVCSSTAWFGSANAESAMLNYAASADNRAGKDLLSTSAWGYFWNIKNVANSDHQFAGNPTKEGKGFFGTDSTKGQVVFDAANDEHTAGGVYAALTTAGNTDYSLKVTDSTVNVSSSLNFDNVNVTGSSTLVLSDSASISASTLKMGSGTITLGKNAAITVDGDLNVDSGASVTINMAEGALIQSTEATNLHSTATALTFNTATTQKAVETALSTSAFYTRVLLESVNKSIYYSNGDGYQSNQNTHITLSDAMLDAAGFQNLGVLYTTDNGATFTNVAGESVTMSGKQYALVYNGTTYHAGTAAKSLMLVATPEPATATLSLLALAALAARRKRH